MHWTQVKLPEDVKAQIERQIEHMFAQNLGKPEEIAERLIRAYCQSKGIVIDE